MTTPIPRILLALDGKIDFTNRSNPFGGGEGGGSSSGDIGFEKIPRDQVAAKLKAALGGRAKVKK